MEILFLKLRYSFFYAHCAINAEIFHGVAVQKPKFSIQDFFSKSDQKFCKSFVYANGINFKMTIYEKDDIGNNCTIVMVSRCLFSNLSNIFEQDFL